VAREHTNERPSCRHCEQYGHEEANCYEIISYPPNWGSCGRGRGSRGGGRANKGGRNISGRGRGAGRETVHSVQAQNEDLSTVCYGPASSGSYGPASSGSHGPAAFGPAITLATSSASAFSPTGSARQGPGSAVSITGLTQDQLQKLLSLIKSRKPDFEKILGRGVHQSRTGPAGPKTENLPNDGPRTGPIWTRSGPDRTESRPVLWQHDNFWTN